MNTEWEIAKEVLEIDKKLLKLWTKRVRMIKQLRKRNRNRTKREV